MLVVRKGQVVYSGWDEGRRYTDLRVDPEKPRYPVPEGLELVNQGGSGVQLEAHFRLLHRFDILDWVNSSLVRFVVRQVFHPIEYLFDADTTLRFDLGAGPQTLKAQGFATLTILNRPPETGW